MEKQFSRAEIEPLIVRAMLDGQIKAIGFCIEYLQRSLEPDLNQLKHLQESGMTLGEPFIRLYVRTSTLLELKKVLEKLVTDLTANNS